MIARLILADAAVTHPDGTFSLLRGGIDRVEVPPNRPASFRGALLVRIEATVAEKGNHTFKLVCVDEDGNPVMPGMNGSFQVPEKGGNLHLAINFQSVFPKLGRYSFIVTLDGQEKDRCGLEFVEKKEGDE